MELETIEIPDMVKLESMAEANRTTLFLLFLQILRIDYKNPAVFGVAEQLGRCYGILDYVRKIPFSLRYHRVTVPQDLLDKHNLTLRNMWDRVYGKANEDLFDVVLEVAAYAREHLLQAIALNDKLPPHAFRAFLYGVEAQYYLQMLEINNFDVFSRQLHKQSYIQVPYKMFRAAKKKQFHLD